MTEGKIDSAPIEEVRGKHHHWTVRLNYSFLVYGKRYTGRYSRKFDYEDDAQSWAHDLQGKTVLVRHSLKWPALSLILDDDLESLLNASPPEPAQLADLPSAASGSWTRKLLAYPCMVIAAAGFLLSLYVHVASWAGKIVLPQPWLPVLQLVMFVPFAAALILTFKTRRRSEVPRVPDSLGKLMIATMAYWLFNLALLLLASVGNHGKADDLHEWRGFSALWMCFYSWSFAFLYAGLRRPPEPPR